MFNLLIMFNFFAVTGDSREICRKSHRPIEEGISEHKKSNEFARETASNLWGNSYDSHQEGM